VRGRLAGGNTRTYTVGVASGQVARLTLIHLGLDVRARVSVPGNEDTLEVDGVQSSRGVEALVVAIPSSGTLRVEVRPFDVTAAEGAFEIVLDGLDDPPSPARLAAAHAWMQTARAGALAGRDDGESRRLAIKAYDEAVTLWRRAGDQRGEATALSLQALACDRVGEKQEAVSRFTAALALQRAIGDAVGEAGTLVDRGATYDDIGDSDRALADLRSALAEFRAQDDARGEARALSNLASVDDKRGDRQRAVAEYAAALDLCRQLGDRLCQAANLNNVGRLHSLLGEPREALTRYQEALGLWQAVGEKGLAAWTVMNMGAVEESIGQPREAAEHYEVALRLNREAGDRRGEAYTLHNRAAVDAELGETQRALDDYGEALVRWQETGDRRGEAATLGNLAKLRSDLGDSEPALELYRRSLALHQASRDKASEAGTRYQLARDLETLGRLQEADGEYAAALSLWQEVGSRRKVGLALAGRGGIALAAGKPDLALALEREALASLRQAQNRRGEAETLRSLGVTQVALGRATEAGASFGEALTIERELGDRAGEAETLFARARLARGVSDLDVAKGCIEAALTLVGQLRARVLSSNLRGSFLAAKRRYFRFYIDLLMDLSRRHPGQGYEALAFRVSEEFHARNLLDSLDLRGADLQAGAGRELVRREQALLTRIAALDVRRTRLAERDEEAAAAPIGRDLSELLSELDRVQAEILEASPHHADLTQPRILTAAEVQSGLLDAQTLVLEYALGPERSFLWVISASTVRSAELPPRGEIDRSVGELLELLRAGPQPLAKGRLDRVAAHLGATLLGQAGDLSGYSRLLVVPDGSLHRLPFAMLPERGSSFEPLVARHEIVVLPSVSVLGALRRAVAGRKTAKEVVAVFADPVFSPDDPRVARREQGAGRGKAGLPDDVARSVADFGEKGLPRLPRSLSEARAIRAVVPRGGVSLAVSFAATKARVLDGSLARYRIVHFATHALLDEKRPELSGLVLSLVDRQGRPRDGFLRMGEIYDLQLAADLVVLSACRTALGKELEGEGLVGLTHGFFHAGASAVVASLWRVDDRATEELMKRLYHKMFQDGLPPAAALQSAQAAMAAAGRPRFDWAGFVFQGDWQGRIGSFVH
jgi:CHAT domain-containing protein/Tfp pilus assembly protein PilF